MECMEHVCFFLKGKINGAKFNHVFHYSTDFVRWHHRTFGGIIEKRAPGCLGYIGDEVHYPVI